MLIGNGDARLCRVGGRVTDPQIDTYNRSSRMSFYASANLQSRLSRHAADDRISGRLLIGVTQKVLVEPISVDHLPRNLGPQPALFLPRLGFLVIATSFHPYRRL